MNACRTKPSPLGLTALALFTMSALCVTAPSAAAQNLPGGGASAGAVSPKWESAKDPEDTMATAVAFDLYLSGTENLADAVGLSGAGGSRMIMSQNAAQSVGGVKNADSSCDHTTHPHGCTDVKDANAVAKELSNPAGSLASLTFKNQFRLYDGDLPDADDQWNYTLLFQPVFPFPLGTTSEGGKKNFFVRPAIPLLVDQPTFNGTKFKGVTALGDIGFDVAYGVTQKTGLIMIGGMVGSLPTATNSDVASKQLRLGPEAFIGQATDWGLVGIFPQHLWNVAGWDDKGHEDFSQTQIQPVLNLNLGDGWVTGSQPMIQYDWEQEQWNVPINLQIGKTVQFGKLPVRFQVEGSYYVERSDIFADKWMIGLNITPVVPNFINSWIRGQ